MNRKRKQWLLHNGKIVVVYGAMLYLAVGVTEMTSTEVKVKAEPKVQMVSEETTQQINVDPVKVETVVEDILNDKKQEKFECNPLGLNEREKYLLAKIAMAEAEGEDTEGKALVMKVVLNRVSDKQFPDTIEDVIYQPRQFSPIGNGRFDKVEPNDDCYKALEMVNEGKWDESQDALYFESRSNSTWHQDNLEYLFKHGNHYFYKDKE